MVVRSHPFASPIRGVTAAFVALQSLACQITPSSKDTGGVNLDASTGCPAGVVMLLGDSSYLSSQVALTSLDGTVLSESFVSTASTQSAGLAFALSGGTGLPSNAPQSGQIVVLDEYGTDVLTWLDAATAHVRAQLPVGTGFESNPQDYLELDSTRALVSRWGEDGSPGDEPFDGGGDVLVIDTETPAILSRIVMPTRNGLPARPSGLITVGSSVAVVLQRLSLDFATYGDSEIVRIDKATLEVIDDLTLSGVSNCGHLVPAPDGKSLGLVCTGPLAANGATSDLSHSAFVQVGIGESGNLIETARWRAAEIAGEPLQSSFDFADPERVLLKTQTPLGGNTNNRLLLANLTTRAVSTLLEASPGFDGKGQGLTFGTVLCAPGCSSVCLLADGDRGLLRRYDMSQSGTELPSVELSSGLGLLPRQLSHFRAP